jgi:protoporphyrinogen oxidase
MGSWNNESTFLDVRNLPKQIYNLGIQEFLAADSPDYSKKSLKVFLEEAFGPTITEHVYRPVIRKILGESLDNVLPEVLIQYSLHRIMAFDSEKSRELKKNPIIDAKLGFHSYKDQPPTKPYLYPVGSEGIGAWVKSLENQLKLKGVKVIKSSSITDIQRTCQGFKVSLCSSELPIVTDIIWTVPAVSAAKALKIGFEYKPPTLRFSTIVNLGFNEPFLRDNHYLLVWDSSMLSFRITLYPNLKAVSLGVFNCSVEILTDSRINDKASLLKTVLKEVTTLGLLSAGARLVESEIIDIGPAFPVKTPEACTLANQVTDLFEDLYPDILFLGKATGRSFLLNDTILYANEMLDRRFRA